MGIVIAEMMIIFKRIEGAKTINEKNMVRKRIPLLGTIIFSAVLLSQELSHVVTVNNISVPVRDYQGDEFV